MAGSAANLALVFARRVGLAGLVCLAVAGCTADGRGTGASLEDSIQSPGAKMMALAPASRTTSTREPLASLPAEAGKVVSVRSHDYVDGLRQDIGLDGSAVRSISNGMTVLVRTVNRATLDEAVPLAKPTEAGIRSEIGAQFPHVPMQVVERSSSNSYGPYGLALGRAGGNARCLYMWQWIDGNRLPQDAGVSGPASIRVRLCRSDMTFDAMAALVDHLAIGPAPASDRVAATDEPRVIVAPSAAGGPASEPDSTTASLPPETKKADAPKAHHVARRRPKSQIAVRTVPAANAGAPQYLTPQAIVAPRTTMAPTTIVPSDLPPQAYLGPKAPH